MFVELVGRGFDDGRRRARPTPRDGDEPPGADDGRSREREHEVGVSAARAGRSRLRTSDASSTARPRARQEAADWTPRQVAMTEPADGRAAAPTRGSRGMFREKSWVFFEILLPFLATSAFVFVYRALQAPPQYIGFVVLGGAMTAFWLNVIWMMAQQLWWEKSQGNLELYFAAPMNIMAVLFGMAFGGFVMSSTRAAAVLVIATIVYGVAFAVDQWVLLIARVPADAGRAVRARDGAREPVPHVGPRGVAPDPAPRRAGLLRVRAELPGRPARGPRLARDRDPAAGGRASTRCASSRSPARPTRSGRRRRRSRR